MEFYEGENSIFISISKNSIFHILIIILSGQALGPDFLMTFAHKQQLRGSMAGVLRHRTSWV